VSVVAIVLLGFGLADLASASAPAKVAPVSIALPLSLALVGCSYVVGLATWQPWVLGTAMFLILSAWLSSRPRTGALTGATVNDPRAELALIAGVVGLSLILAGSFPNVSGAFQRWFVDLPLYSLRANSNQVALAIAAFFFMLHTGNRIIRLVLAVVGAEVEAGQEKLKGGRYIGPIERLIVAALMLAGSLEGAGLIIAAKGFIRLPEIRSETESEHGVGDSVAEYFLIGTLTSIAIAGALAALILGTSG
jgi:hypothetical protein